MFRRAEELGTDAVGGQKRGGYDDILVSLGKFYCAGIWEVEFSSVE